jgi:hypothetical protein
MRFGSAGIALCIAAWLLAGQAVTATPVQWSANQHYYDFVSAPGETWTEAEDAASGLSHLGMQGHLATITSADENDFIYNTFSWTDFWEAWLGGYQTPGSAPADNWNWVTGEAWVYTNWVPGEPNDSGGPEDYLQMWGPGTTGPSRWNDDANATALGNISGYFVEYSAPIPEPATCTLLGAGILALAAGTIRRRRRFRHTPPDLD